MVPFTGASPSLLITCSSSRDGSTALFTKSRKIHTPKAGEKVYANFPQLSVSSIFISGALSNSLNNSTFLGPGGTLIVLVHCTEQALITGISVLNLGPCNNTFIAIQHS